MGKIIFGLLLKWKELNYAIAEETGKIQIILKNCNLNASKSYEMLVYTVLHF